MILQSGMLLSCCVHFPASFCEKINGTGLNGIRTPPDLQIRIIDVGIFCMISKDEFKSFNKNSAFQRNPRTPSFYIDFHKRDDQ
jgi:hypothetical protein